MYDELIEELRRHHCDAKEDDTQEVCEECPYDVIIVGKSAPSGIASVCVCGLMNRAANVIEELSKPKWISVEKKLAEWPCIAYDANGNLPFIPHGILTITDAQGTWQIDARLADSALHQGKIKPVLGYGNRITHWMPLPEPPKEE